MNIPPDLKIGTVGHCIYCPNDGTTESLSGEHVIPLSFGGYRVLAEASCEKCAAITGAIEGHCCSGMFKALRVHQQLPTRRKKNRPKTLTILAGATPHDAPQEEIPVDRAPGAVVFPLLAPPGILLANGAPPNPLLGFHISATTEDAAERQKKLTAEGRPGALLLAAVNVHDFARTLAKIAHGYVVANAGLDGFKPLLPAVILGQSAAVYDYVGGATPTPQIPIVTPEPNRAQGAELHQVRDQPITLRGKKYISVEIRLFALLEPAPPLYRVMVGEYL